VQLAEALKKIRAEKPKENFMLLEFGYGPKFVLPYEKGVSVMAALTNAESLIDEYGSKKRIDACPRDHIRSSIFSYQEYERYKLSALLNLTFEEVKEMMEAQNKPPEPVTP
jgi:hypothetical protein